MIVPILKKLIARKDLTGSETEYAIDSIMSGVLTDSQAASLLTAFQMKKVTDEEILSIISAVKKRSITVKPKTNSIVDACGTGGDNSGTFNISTAAAFVAAGAGVTIAKHGNRASSSKCGSADVLESLGVKINIEPKKAEKIIDEIGICFLFAQVYHPSFRNISKIRKELGFKNIFNLIGPLCSPANAKRQVIGVYDPNLTEKIAKIAQLLEKDHVLVVNGDGLDEITINGKTKISELKDGIIKTYYLDAEKLGFSPCRIEELKGDTPEKNSEIILSVLKGIKGKKRDIVLLNAAAAIYVSGKATSIKKGIELAEDSIDSGKALKKLNELIKETNSP
jgi:anthranilate phosphoribosyltransferase